MKITLKDGSVKEYEGPKSVYEIAADLSEGLARAACAGEINGKTVDLRTVVEEDCSLNILTANDLEVDIVTGLESGASCGKAYLLSCACRGGKTGISPGKVSDRAGH